MTSVGYHHPRSGVKHVSSRDRSNPLRIFTPSPSTTVERFLLTTTVVLMPLQNHLPAIAGFSILYVMFIVLTCYVILNRAHILDRIWLRPLFVAAYAMLFLISLLELSHPYSDIPGLFRISLMIVGAMLVATLCRDRRALQAAVYGYLIAGLSMSILLLLTLYGGLRAATATDFRAATRLRGQVFAENPLAANENYMAFVAAQGAVVALILAMTARSPYLRKLFLGVTLLCFLATFLPMSRSGATIVIATSTIVMVAYGIKQMRTMMLAATLVLGMLIWVPDAVFSRMTFSTESHHGKMEARARIYTEAIELLPNYGLIGVGKGNFWESWGELNGFTKAIAGNVLGPHSWYVGATIYWGVPGLFALMLVIYQAYRCIPKRCGADSLSLCLFGIAVSLFLYSLVTHDLANKAFSLGFGLLVANQLWIWPQGIVQTVSQRPSSLHSTR